MHIKSKSKRRCGGRLRRRMGKGVGNIMKLGNKLLKAPGELLVGMFDPRNWKKLFGGKKRSGSGGGGPYSTPYGGNRKRGGNKYGGNKYGGNKYGGGGPYGGRVSNDFKPSMGHKMAPGHHPEGERKGGVIGAIASAVLPTLMQLFLDDDT